jgi:hypothetical protein
MLEHHYEINSLVSLIHTWNFATLATLQKMHDKKVHPYIGLGLNNNFLSFGWTYFEERCEIQLF